MIIMTCMSLLTGCGEGSARGGQDSGMTASEEAGVETPAAEEQDSGTLDTEEQDGVASDTEKQNSGDTDTEEQDSVAGEQGGEPAVTNDGRGELISDEDAASLQCVKKYMVEDVYGDGNSYEVYAPDGSENDEGYLSYIDHGIVYFASVYSGGDKELPFQVLNESLKMTKVDWEQEEAYSDVQISEVIKNGADRYAIVSAKSQDLFGTDYVRRMLFYLDIPETGVGVLWELDLSEIGMDEVTAQILSELGQCYGIGLEGFVPKGEWAQADKDRQIEAQDVYEPEEGEQALTKVDGYQYLGMTTLSLDGGKIQCPVLALMGYTTSVRSSYTSATMHGVSLSIDGSSTGTDEYVPLFKEGADRLYRQKLEDEDVENRNVHKSEVMEMAGYDNAWYYIVDYETPDLMTQEYYREVRVNCRIIIEEKYALTCDITLRDNNYDKMTNTVIKELETAYGIDLAEYYNEEE